ncbi:class I SAM-dependent methyltransferase [Phenylobacterium sp.]|uniref:class I SAM-dependent methyltransferase n=1 Tax=Phenylobacterium sp. TaxID=1871053 RepID=UPI002F928115
MAPSPISAVEHPRVRAWLEIRDPLERQLAPLGEAVLGALALRPGERVLDVGCGIGRTPWRLAEAVGPAGRVTGVDLLPAALAVAEADPDLPANVDFLCGDAAVLAFEPGAVDAVFSRFGVMFFEAPERAFDNLRRALRPGGRIGFVCWRGLADNELDSFPLTAASPHLPAELTAGTQATGWFSFSDPERIRSVLGQAGLEQIEVRPHDALVGSGDLAGMVAVCSRVGALGAILREHPEFADKAASALEQALRALDGPGGPHLRAATWVVTARRPA